jgi:hypothetical protein
LVALVQCLVAYARPFDDEGTHEYARFRDKRILFIFSSERWFIAMTKCLFPFASIGKDETALLVSMEQFRNVLVSDAEKALLRHLGSDSGPIQVRRTVNIL